MLINFPLVLAEKNILRSHLQKTLSFLCIRKCKLKTTGPWILVESDIRLVDVAIQTDPGDTVAYCVGVWAVSTNGDVYYRDSVFATQPTVKIHLSQTSRFSFAL